MDNAERRILLGQAVRKAREQQHISQRQLALMIGNESHANLSKIENGQANVKFDTICNIADALDVEVSYFYAGF